MIDYIPDNLSEWERHDAEQEDALKRLPVCVDCDRPIQDRYYYINGESICADCIEDYAREVETE